MRLEILRNTAQDKQRKRNLLGRLRKGSMEVRR